MHSAECGVGAVDYCDRIGFEALRPVIAVQIRGHDDGHRSFCRRAEQSRLLAMVVGLWLPAAGADQHG